MPRIFVSVPVNNAHDLEPLFRDLARVRGVKTSPAYQLHITLCFIGEIPEEQVETVNGIVESAVKGVRKGRISLKGVGCFPTPKRPKIVWAGVESEIPLSQIAGEISMKLDAAGIPHDDKPFKPHITVGRVQGTPDLTTLVNKYRTTEFATFLCRDVMVMSSELRPEGARHKIVCACELS